MGPVDGATVPHLIWNILGTEIEATPHLWARLNSRGSGYPRKLMFAVRQAKDAGVNGLVAVVDRDKMPDRTRLASMREARDKDRQTTPPFPTVLGEADPHGEAWLLDDEVAVRQGLRLSRNYQIPSVRTVASPKEALSRLIRQSERQDVEVMEVLKDVARGVVPTRCNHANETGFQGLIEETKAEFGPDCSWLS